MFRKASVDCGYDKPQECLGIRSFIVSGWRFQSGPLWCLGIRVLGLYVEIHWHWMSEQEEENWGKMFDTILREDLSDEYDAQP